jgi:3-oxoacyl-[acyl-carrier protein] reductase
MDKLFDFTGRRALVTGAGQGIGRSIAEALAERGAEVAIHYRSSQTAAEKIVASIKQAGGKAVALHADLSAPGGVGGLCDAVAAHWDSLDILVNNAGGVTHRARFPDSDEAYCRELFDLNLNSCIELSRRVLPLLQRSTDPAIINMTSIAAYNGGQGGVSIYAAAKAGIIGLTRSLAHELGPKIRVNAIAPGVVLTDFHRRHSTAEDLEKIAARTALHRNGEADEIVGTALLLAGPAGSFITGEVIHVNGGLWTA